MFERALTCGGRLCKFHDRFLSFQSSLCLFGPVLFFETRGLQPARLLCPWGFSRQGHWSGLPCPPPGDLPYPGIEPGSPALQEDSLPFEPPGKPPPSPSSLMLGFAPPAETVLTCSQSWSLLLILGLMYIKALRSGQEFLCMHSLHVVSPEPSFSSVSRRAPYCGTFSQTHSGLRVASELEVFFLRAGVPVRAFDFGDFCAPRPALRRVSLAFIIRDMTAVLTAASPLDG